MMYGDPDIFTNPQDYFDLYKPMAEIELNEDTKSNKRKVKVAIPEEIKTVSKKPEKTVEEVKTQEVKPSETSNEEVPAPPKRKRGRPRKNPLPEETTKE